MCARFFASAHFFRADIHVGLTPCNGWGGRIYQQPYFLTHISMKNSLLSFAVTATVFVGALINDVDAGVSNPVLNPKCDRLDCSVSGCKCATGCGCAPDQHDYFMHAPIGVMGDHIHRKGGVMASYRYMYMNMERNYDGDSTISDADARVGYMGNAAEMSMEMHMLGVMYAPSDRLTLMLMSHYIESSMLNVNMMGQETDMRSSGWGDVTLSAYYGLYKKPKGSAHVGLGLSAPTGSIDERMSSGMRMGYPMQLGSGTWDLKPSYTVLREQGDLSYGGQVSAVIHLGENDNGYTLGDSLKLTAWVSRRLTDRSSVSLRLTGSTWGNVDGSDDEMPVIPMGPLAGQPMAGAVDPDARGGSRVDLSAGLNLWSSELGARFAVEVGAPVYQNLDGPQLGTEWFMTTGLQFAW